MAPRSFQKFLTVPAVLFFLVISAKAAFAEDISREVETVRRETRSAGVAARVAAKSEEKAGIEKYKTGVTYEDILKDPDNIDLNYRYAREQISRDELAGASSTLERILLLNPDLVDARLLYAVVLYRLNSLEDAKKELDLLEGVSLPANIKTQVAEYQRKIKLKQRRTHFGLRESLGWGYDTNRNASPYSKQQLSYDVMTDVTGSNVRRPDTHFVNITSFDVTHDLGFKAGHTVFGSFTYFLQEQTNVHSLDLGSFQYELGGTYKSEYVNFTPSFYATHLFLSSETFLRSQGGNFLFDHDFTKSLNAFYNFRIERQDYLNISESNTSRDRKGPQFDNFWGFNYKLRPTMKWTTSLGYSEKFAKQDFDAYSRISLNNTHLWLWPKGQFLINSLNAYFDNYDAPDFSVASKIRHDRSMRYRVTYGIPLETALIGKVLPKPFRDIVFTFTYEYYHALSSVTNYTYTNSKLEGLFTKRFEF